MSALFVQHRGVLDVYAFRKTFGAMLLSFEYSFAYFLQHRGVLDVYDFRETFGAMLSLGEDEAETIFKKVRRRRT